MASLRSEGRKTGLLQHWPLEAHISPSMLEETEIHHPTCRILPLSWIVLKPGKDSYSAVCLAPYHSLREGWHIIPLGFAWFCFLLNLLLSFIPSLFLCSHPSFDCAWFILPGFLLKLVEHSADKQLSVAL